MVWILPTYNRPAQCAAVLNRLVDKGVSTDGVVVVNGEDGSKVESEVETAAVKMGWDVVKRSENVGALGALNFVFKERPNEKFYGFIGDDEFVETDNWNTKLIEAAGDWDISHGDDGVQGGKRAQSYLCIGGALARGVGYLAIPECWHWYGLDDMWELLARMGVCKKVFVPEVKIDHRHPYQGKGEMDATYALGESRKDIDYQIFCHWQRTELKNVCERVKKARGAA